MLLHVIPGGISDLIPGGISLIPGGISGGQKIELTVRRRVCSTDRRAPPRKNIQRDRAGLLVERPQVDGVDRPRLREAADALFAGQTHETEINEIVAPARNVFLIDLGARGDLARAETLFAGERRHEPANRDPDTQLFFAGGAFKHNEWDVGPPDGRVDRRRLEKDDVHRGSFAAGAGTPAA